MWNTLEQDSIRQLLLTPSSPLRTALEKFLRQRADARRRDCVMALMTLPREWELAADYAAKSEVYESLLTELEHQADQPL